MNIQRWAQTVSANDLPRLLLPRLNALSSMGEREKVLIALVKRGNKEKELGRVMDDFLFKCPVAAIAFGRKERTRSGTKALLASLAKKRAKG